MHALGDPSPKNFGTGGDCQTWNICPEAKIGNFQISLPKSVQIDWDRTADWTVAGWIGSGYDSKAKSEKFKIVKFINSYRQFKTFCIRYHERF